MLHDLLRQRRRIAFAVLFSQLTLLWIWPGVVMLGVMASCVLTVSVLIVIAVKHRVRCCRILRSCYDAANPYGPNVVAVSALTFEIFYTYFLDRFPIQIG